MSYYEGIEAVKELDDAGSVNDHLKDGWIILKIGEKSKITVNPETKLPVHEVSIIYVMGYKEQQSKPETLEDKLKWIDTSGPHGSYQKLGPSDSQEYQTLLKELQDHQSKMVKEGYFLWLFKDNAIGKKRLSEK